METVIKYFHLIIGAIVSMFLMSVADKLLKAFSGSLLSNGYGSDIAGTQFWLLATEAGHSCIQAFIAIGAFATFAFWQAIVRVSKNVFSHFVKKA